MQDFAVAREEGMIHPLVLVGQITWSGRQTLGLEGVTLVQN